jgi:hypothetical protein
LRMASPLERLGPVELAGDGAGGWWRPEGAVALWKITLDQISPPANASSIDE